MAEKKRMTPDDIKVRVVYSEGYRKRYTKACLDILAIREKLQKDGAMLEKSK